MLCVEREGPPGDRLKLVDAEARKEASREQALGTAERVVGGMKLKIGKERGTCTREESVLGLRAAVVGH